MARTAEELVPLPEVQELALAAVSPLPAVRVAVDTALGLVTAEDVFARENVPPFANSAMDGYAVRAEDCQDAGAELDVIGVVPAGTGPDLLVGSGQAAQIMTGAPIPAGATGIAIVERVEQIARPSGPAVRLLDAVAEGTHIRQAGSDIEAGTVVAAAGTVLNPAHIGVLASVGVGSVLAHPLPRVGVMTTGDELVELAADGSARELRPG
ncbi:MAG TPA: hypothetical protein VGP46_02615, partial [Acidimicrobiales bacterium]|nr:hypothetical protein [Acidimicrobiales bacterium]